MKRQKKFAAKAAHRQRKVKLRHLPAAVRRLDEIIGGGLPEFSFSTFAGAPGGGKTTLAHQFVFANANRQRPALYFTVLGTPALKMLRYQQQYSFFEPPKLHGVIRFINLSVVEKSLEGVLEEIPPATLNIVSLPPDFLS